MEKIVVKNSIIYTLVSILQKGMMFILLPVYTNFLSTSEFGILNVVTSVISLLSALFLLSLHGAATRFYFLEKYHNERKQVWGTILIMVFINSGILGFLFFVFKNALLLPLAKGISFYPFLFLGLLTTILNPLYLFFQTYLQTIQNAKKYAINLLMNFTLNVILILFFLIVLEKGILGILIANLITATVFFIYSAFYFIPKIKIRFEKKIAIDSLKYSLPLVPHSVSAWVTSMVDKIILNNLLSASSVGVYSAGFQIGSGMNIVTGAFSQAYSPWFFQKNNEGDSGLLQVYSFVKLASLLYAVAATCLSLVAKFICDIFFAQNFREAYIVIPFVAFAFAYSGLYSLFVVTLFLKRTYLVTVITISSAFVVILSNYLMIPHWGFLGSGFSILISYIISALLAWCLSYHENIKFPLQDTVGIVTLYFILSLVLIYSTLIFFKILAVLVLFVCSTIAFFQYRKSLMLYLKSFRRR